MTEPTKSDGKQPRAASEETEVARGLLAHCADALGMDTDSEGTPSEAQALGENILEFIGFAEEWLDTDSRTRIADRLLETLEADTPSDPDAWPTTIAAVLGITPDEADALVEALLYAALRTEP
jgi:hypothetical protein